MYETNIKDSDRLADIRRRLQYHFLLCISEKVSASNCRVPHVNYTTSFLSGVFKSPLVLKAHHGGRTKKRPPTCRGPERTLRNCGRGPRSSGYRSSNRPRRQKTLTARPSRQRRLLACSSLLRKHKNMERCKTSYQSFWFMKYRRNAPRGHVSGSHTAVSRHSVKSATGPQHSLINCGNHPFTL